MKQPVADILSNLVEQKKTGVLNFSINSEKNLCKIYFRAGDVYHISFGFIKGLECINQIKSKEILSYNFIPDITVDLTSNDLSSTSQIIELFKKMDKFVKEDEKNLKIQNLDRIKDILKIALIRQIGPIGGKITERYIKEKWKPLSPPTKEDYMELINLLAQEIEEPQSRKDFFNETNKILEVLK